MKQNIYKHFSYHLKWDVFIYINVRTENLNKLTVFIQIFFFNFLYENILFHTEN